MLRRRVAGAVLAVPYEQFECGRLSSSPLGPPLREWRYPLLMIVTIPKILSSVYPILSSFVELQDSIYPQSVELSSSFGGSSNIELQEETMLSLGLKEEEDAKIPCSFSEYAFFSYKSELCRNSLMSRIPPSASKIRLSPRHSCIQGDSPISSGILLRVRLLDQSPQQSSYVLPPTRTAQSAIMSTPHYQKETI
ncbi:hypothetical protein KSP39_PZI012946 [Platanthera zijinensis]|uniref:Uncharacterized protein n=1 Tax=Platanthera zijinensis TaxID=2320716 RepID=A0AAP0BDV6_9ASPA